MSNTGDMMIRVFGDPEAWPKVITGTRKARGRTFATTVKKDWREKTVINPFTGEKKKKRTDRGYKMRWFYHVRDCVKVWMEENGREPFEAHHPIALGCLFFVTKSKSSKLIYPTSTPDFDNIRYGLPNVLKRTPDIKRGKIPGPYPNGIAFHDDDQVIWTANPDGELWATQSNPPGVLITIIDLLKHPDMLEWGRRIDKELCADLAALGKVDLDG